jgi:hypothetical protein
MEEYAVAAGELADSVVVVAVGNAFEWCHMRRRRWRRMPECMAEGSHSPLTKCWLELLPAVDRTGLFGLAESEKTEINRNIP